MKKRRYSISIALLLLVVSVFAGAQQILPVQAASVQISINGTELQDGKCYVFDTTTNQMHEYDPDTDSNSDYISYNSGVMEVYGNVTINACEYGDTILYIKNGTLTLKGNGNLKIDCGSWSRKTVITGTADAALTTDAYTGNLVFRAYDGNAIIQGLASVDLRTTGTITLTGSHVIGDAFISAGSVNLEANNFSFNLKATMNVKHLIEATDTQNGKITVTKTGTNEELMLGNGYSTDQADNIYVSDAFFKGKDVVVSSKGWNTSNQSINFKGNTIAEGNLTINATYDVYIKTQGNLVNGNLEIHSATKRDVILKSENGSLSTGNTYIDAIEATTTLEGKDAAINGNATIKTAVLEISSKQNAAIAGNADLRTTAGLIKLSGSEGYSVIAGNTIQLNANNGTVVISRTGSGATDTPPILGGTLQSDRGAILYNDGGTQWLQMMETGKVYYAENCEHPIVDGYTGGCLVCGASVACVELIGGDGTSNGELIGAFGGGSATDVLGKVSAGYTIKFIKDVYCPARVASMSDKDSVTIDLNGHELTVQCISSSPNLTIKNGTYVGDIKDDTAGGILNLQDVKVTLRTLEWNDTTNGVNLENSQVTIAAAAGQTGTCRLEKLAMDENSKLVLQNATDGISNAGQNSLEDSFGSIQDFLPKGYSLARITVNNNPRNTIVDSNGNIATDIVLRYRRMTDKDMNIVPNATSLVYDKTAKEPELLVTYEGQALVKGTDYTVAYTDNTDAGDAIATVTGIGTYHGSVQLRFTIEKANQAAPTGLIAVKASKSGALDGALENLSSAMEYSTDKLNWTAVTSGTKVNGLVAGDYYVRYAATKNYNASPATKVVITVDTATTKPAAPTTDKDTTKDTTKDTPTEATSDVKNVNTGDKKAFGMVVLLMFAVVGMTFTVISGKKVKNKN